MHVTITGASGFIGRQLLKLLASQGHTLQVLSRRADATLPGAPLSLWNPVKELPPEAALRGAGAAIHLAGEPVGQRWTAEAKRRIRESRVAGTRNLVQALARMEPRPPVLVCASAIGYYGTRGDEVLTEDSAAGGDYLAEVCAAWEREAAAAEALGMRVVRVRTGLVLAAHGGALARMLPPFRLGVGGRLGDGRQWMSWIHLDDLCEMFRFAAENPVSGAWNGVAPQPVTNADFTRMLAKVLKRPALFPVPGFGLRALFGEMAGVLLASQRVLPEAAGKTGFRFRYPQLDAALQAALR